MWALEKTNQLKILVIDDDCVSNVHIKDRLEKCGHYVQTHESPIMGIELALSSQFDVIIVDYLMPQMDGVQVLRRIREQNRYIPVLMLTVYDKSSIATEFMAVGGSDFIPKPLPDCPHFAKIIECATERMQRLYLEHERCKEFTAHTAAQSIKRELLDILSKKNIESAIKLLETL